MELSLVWTIAQAELRQALHNKWLWLYAVGFAGLALALSQAGLSAAGYAGLGGFGRTAASLINALLLFVPLIGLSVGAGTVAADRERGTLLYLLAQPVSRAEIFGGKALGAVLAVVTALSLGFGLAAFALGLGGSSTTSSGSTQTIYLSLVGYTLLLALAALGVGFIISTLTRKAAAASGAALIVWLGLVFVADLGVMGATLAWRPSPSELLWLLVINPLQIFKLGAIHSLHASLDTLGPVGQYALHRFGEQLPLLLIGLLLLWALAAFGLAFAIFNRRGEG